MSYPVIKNFLFFQYNFEFIFQSITLLTINLHFCLYFLWFLVNISLPVAYTISGCTRSLVRPPVPENLYLYCTVWSSAVQSHYSLVLEPGDSLIDVFNNLSISDITVMTVLLEKENDKQK